MSWLFVEERFEYSDVDRRNASSKAQDDVSAVLDEMGLQKVEHMVCGHAATNICSKVREHLVIARSWVSTLAAARTGDSVVIQYPPRDHSLLFFRALRGARKRGVRICLLLHDVDMLRDGGRGFESARMRREDVSAFRASDVFVTHNARMTEALCEMMPGCSGKTYELGIFDYLLPTNAPFASCALDGGVVIAGNLIKEKAGYVYSLPSDVDFDLYGMGWEGAGSENVRYHGSLLPEELPGAMQGSFGLVWDGPDPETCAGVYGEYLRINNPHKASLYLASGLPVIIWEQAALAPFVLEHGVGLTVRSLTDISDRVAHMDAARYQSMVVRTRELSTALRTGSFMHHVMAELMGDA